MRHENTTLRRTITYPRIEDMSSDTPKTVETTEVEFDVTCFRAPVANPNPDIEALFEERLRMILRLMHENEIRCIDEVAVYVRKHS